MAIDRGSVFMPVKLLISEEENITRIQNHDRRIRYKSTDVREVYPEHSLIPISHPNLVELDVTNLSAKAAAERILDCVTLVKGEIQS